MGLLSLGFWLCTVCFSGFDWCFVFVVELDLGFVLFGFLLWVLLVALIVC